MSIFIVYTPFYNLSPKKKHLEKLTFCIIHRFNIGTYDY